MDCYRLGYPKVEVVWVKFGTPPCRVLGNAYLERFNGLKEPQGIGKDNALVLTHLANLLDVLLVDVMRLLLVILSK